jgi:hypothetical protein
MSTTEIPVGDGAPEIPEDDPDSPKPNTVVGYQCEQRILACLYKNHGQVTGLKPGQAIRKLARLLAVEYEEGTVHTGVLQLERKGLVNVDRRNRFIYGVYLVDAIELPATWALRELEAAIAARKQMGRKYEKPKASKGRYVEPPQEWKDAAVRYESASTPHGAPEAPETAPEAVSAPPVALDLTGAGPDLSALARALLKEALAATALFENHVCAPQGEVEHWRAEATRLHEAAQSAENRLARYRDEARQSNADLEATKKSWQADKDRIAQLEANLDTAVATARDLHTAMEAKDRTIRKLRQEVRRLETVEHKANVDELLSEDEKAALTRLQEQLRKAGR